MQSNDETETDNDDIVKLRVGGRPFNAQRSRLCRNRDSMLGAMFCGLHYLVTNSEGEHEIPDRDPDLFELLLEAVNREDGLLDLTAMSPEWFENQHALSFLVDEFSYFGMQSILCQLHAKTSGLLDGNLLNAEQAVVILSWLSETPDVFLSGPPEPHSRWRLGYKATRDGFSSFRFHQLCDRFEESIVCISIRGNGFLYGGYTDQSWGGGGDRLCFNEKKSSTSSFLFSLMNSRSQTATSPYRMDINLQLNSSGSGAILCSPFWGPTFGAAQSDLWLADDMRGGHNNLGNTYRLPAGISRTEAREFLAGSYCTFVTKDIEVYGRGCPE